MEQLLHSFLHKNKVYSYDEKDISLQLMSHSEYPSLRSITDTLDYFGIDNVAANVPSDALTQLPKTFLALIKTETAEELTLVVQKKSTITTTSLEGKKEQLTVSDFKKIWTGTLIAIEVAEEQTTSIKKRISSVHVMLGLTVLAILSVTFFGPFSWTQSAYTFLSVLGLGISYLISKEALGIKDTVTAKVCGAISNSGKGCSNVINSSEGKIIAGLGLSDLSFVFFASTLLTSLFVTNAFSLLLMVAIASLPVIVYTIAVQSFKLKQFCFLCMAISFVLLSQFALISTTATWDFSFNSTSQFFLIATLTASVYLLIKPLWKDSIALDTTKKEFLKFKRNPIFFNEALRQSKKYTVADMPQEHIVSFGNAKAPIAIQAVTNPFCGFCKEPFLTYAKLLKTYPEEIQLQLIFNVAADPENDATKIAMTALDLYTTDPSLALSALEYWYNNKDIDDWKTTYAKNGLEMLYPQQVLESHSKWCQESAINYTPKTLINRKSYPSNEYEIADLPFFIEELKNIKKLKPIT